jgi:hypothetical protein
MEAIRDAAPAGNRCTRTTNCSLDDRFLCLVQCVEHIVPSMPLRIYVGDESL